MNRVSLNDIKKLAHVSRINILDSEVDLVRVSIEEILNYVDILNKIDLKDVTKENPMQNENIFREDFAIDFDAEKLLKNAPERIGSSFVVPSILKTT